MLILWSSSNLSTLGILGLSVSLCNILLLWHLLSTGLWKYPCCLFSCKLCGKHHLKKKSDCSSAAVLIFTNLTYTIWPEHFLPFTNILLLLFSNLIKSFWTTVLTVLCVQQEAAFICCFLQIVWVGFLLVCDQNISLTALSVLALSIFRSTGYKVEGLGSVLLLFIRKTLLPFGKNPCAPSGGWSLSPFPIPFCKYLFFTVPIS